MSACSFVGARVATSKTSTFPSAPLVPPIGPWAPASSSVLNPNAKLEVPRGKSKISNPIRRGRMRSRPLLIAELNGSYVWILCREFEQILFPGPECHQKTDKFAAVPCACNGPTHLTDHFQMPFREIDSVLTNRSTEELIPAKPKNPHKTWPVPCGMHRLRRLSRPGSQSIRAWSSRA